MLLARASKASGEVLRANLNLLFWLSLVPHPPGAPTFLLSDYWLFIPDCLLTTRL